MEEYVVPEFYDVLVGGTDASGSPGTGGGGSVATGNAKATWDENGITGQGWTLYDYEKECAYDASGTTEEEIKQKVSQYLNNYGAFFLNSTNHGCAST